MGSEMCIRDRPYSEADAEWDAFVAAHPRGSLLQTTSWAQLKSRFGWSTQRVWMRRDGRLVGGAQVLFRSVALGIVKLGYVPHGPLVDWHDAEQVDVLFNHIDQAAYERGAGIVKICLLYTSVAADEGSSVDLGGSRNIKKKKN